jgi:putative methyltransferase (TIGR04325 family)
MRRTIKLLLPPIILSLAVKLYGKLKNNVIRKNLSGYENPILVENVIKKSLSAKESIFAEKKINLDAIRVFLPFALAKIQIKSVLEFGGGAGYHYFNAAAAGLVDEINWTIVETPEFCKQASNYKELSKIKFIHNLESANSIEHEDVDLIYCSRALQYFDDPFKTLRQILSINAKYLYLTGITFSPDNEIHEYTQKSLLSSNGPQAEEIETANFLVDYKLQLLPERMVEKEITQFYSIELRINEEPVVHLFRGKEIPYKGIWAIRRDLV